jgi:uncharacterized RDD family membrane protein YckC
MKLGKMIQTLKILTRLFAKPEFFYQIVWELPYMIFLLDRFKKNNQINNE